MTWNDAVAFVNWLTKKESRTYRLPTEAQWEYAARAGTATRYISGTLEASLDGYANLADISTKTRFPKWSSFLFNDGYIYTSPVGSFRANPMGLHDMTGNVWEWCQDAYAADYYTRSPRRDPMNDQQTGFRVARGAPGQAIRRARMWRADLRSHRTSAVTFGGFVLSRWCRKS